MLLSPVVDELHLNRGTYTLVFILLYPSQTTQMWVRFALHRACTGPEPRIRILNSLFCKALFDHPIRC